MTGSPPDADEVHHSDETVVRSTCPACGTVDVPADAVTLLVTSNDADPLYRYTCPQCYATVEKPTSTRAIAMLRGAGARVVLVPAEVTERTGNRRGLDDDDLLEFARALTVTDDLARLAAEAH